MSDGLINPDEIDHEFFDILYQQWSNTTGAKDTYWMPVLIEDEDGKDGGNYAYDLTAVPLNEKEGDFHGRQFIGSFRTEEDAEFVAGLHGAIPDLIRRLHDAIDLAARKDHDNDVAQWMLGEALLENQALRRQVRSLEKALGE